MIKEKLNLPIPIQNLLDNLRDTRNPTNIRTNYRNTLEAIQVEIEAAIKDFDIEQTHPIHIVRDQPMYVKRSG